MLMDSPSRPPTQDELEALIREARQRQLRRRLGVAAVVALAAGAALGIYSVLASGSVASGSGRPPSLTGSDCRMANFAVKEIPISNPTGLDRIGLQVTNRGAGCRLGGYPVLRFSDAEGTIPFLFRYLGKPRLITVSERHSIFSIFSKFRCDIGVTRSTIKTTLGLPNDPNAAATFASPLGGPSICKPGISAEGRWVTVTPFQSLGAAYRVSLVGNGTGP